VEHSRSVNARRISNRPGMVFILTAAIFITSAVLRKLAIHASTEHALQDPAKLDRPQEAVMVAPAPRSARKELDRHVSPHTRAANLLLATAALGMIALAEVITAFTDVRYGVAGHVVLLVLFLALGALASDQRLQAFFLAITVAPLIRIVSLGMPLSHFPQTFWYVLTAVPLFLAAFLITRMLEIPSAALNLRFPRWRRLPVDLLVSVSGIGLGVVEWRILGTAPLVHTSSIAWIIGASLILLLCTGFLEELLFRGLIQHVVATLLGPNMGLVVTSALFGVLHVGYHSVLDLAFVTAVALYFGLAVRYTRSLFGVSMAHGVINIMLFIVLPLSLR